LARHAERRSKTRPLAPILACIVPITMTGALAGGLGGGYLSLQLNHSAVVIGVGVGLVMGTAGGFGLGILGVVPRAVELG
jgi:hypothetical protein